MAGVCWLFLFFNNFPLYPFPPKKHPISNTDMETFTCEKSQISLRLGSGLMGFLVWPFLLHLPWVGGFPVRTHMPQMDAFASLKRFLSSFSFIVNITLAIGRTCPGEGWKGEFLLSAFRTVILWTYLFTFPTSPCMNLALLPSHLSHSQNNKRLIYWLPFDEFLMPRMCVLTGVSPYGSSGSGILRGTAGPEWPLTSP